MKNSRKKIYFASYGQVLSMTPMTALSLCIKYINREDFNPYIIPEIKVLKREASGCAGQGWLGNEQYGFWITDYTKGDWLLLKAELIEDFGLTDPRPDLVYNNTVIGMY